MEQIAKPRGAMPRVTNWNAWITYTTPFSSGTKERRRLPDGFKVGQVPKDQLDVVLATSTIKRQASTYLTLPSVGLLNEEGLLIAWSFIGIDGSLATLYVLPEYRGRGLASYVAGELLRKLKGGDFKDMGYDGTSGCVQSDVKDGNEGSERVIRALGGKILWTSNYVWVDSDKF
jgi:GNAT superfamily N-acetyltransferase